MKRTSNSVLLISIIAFMSIGMMLLKPHTDRLLRWDKKRRLLSNTPSWQEIVKANVPRMAELKSTELDSSSLVWMAMLPYSQEYLIEKEIDDGHYEKVRSVRTYDENSNLCEFVLSRTHYSMEDWSSITQSVIEFRIYNPELKVLKQGDLDWEVTKQWLDFFRQKLATYSLETSAH